MAEVNLTQILASREERVKKQKIILKKFNNPVISFTMNIAGPVKTTPLIERAFYEGLRQLEENISEGIVYRDISVNITGCEALFSVNEDAAKLKIICTEIEENTILGRLFDMDVIDVDESKLERKHTRGCFVCGAQGRECAASRRHSVEELQKVTQNIIKEYFFNKDKELCSYIAVKSLLDEVKTTPKPGLVDLNNNGSHKDMNIELFLKSANSLKEYFKECFLIGYKNLSAGYDKTFMLLRKAGIEAEKTMYEITGGVNTHKGAIYSMGILCASVGRLWLPENPFADSEAICLESSELVRNSVKEDFKKIDGTTAGGKLYLKYGICGIRGEVQSGFSSVLKFGLPYYNKLKDKGYSQNEAGAVTLINLIANVKDTNVFNRGGIEGGEFASYEAGKLVKQSSYPTIEQIKLLDEKFIKRNLSPGGCADLLAVTYFLYYIDKQKEGCRFKIQ